MNREATIKYLDENPMLEWDIVVIGGGATGCGVALDATLRGFKTLLLEKDDFAKGTSSRSTKLVHGGVRYLAQGDFSLVLEALKERGLLLRNAPHLTSNQTFVIPSYSLAKGLYYTAGLKLYDLLSGKRSLGKSAFIGAEKVHKLLPGLKKEKIKNGIVYHDGQFDDSRLVINLAQSIYENGGSVLNYVQVVGLGKNSDGEVKLVTAKDRETGREYSIKTKSVINATGVFVDEIMSMDLPDHKPTVRPSQGTHIVLDSSFLPGENALMIPETSDGRVLFAIPWHGKIVVGTTDVQVNQASSEPKPGIEEVEFILKTFNEYAAKKAEITDILSVFSGLRPLAIRGENEQKTKEISRNHKLISSPSKLITITGGKWTTYRKMAEETVDLAISICGLEKRNCKTENFKIHGYKSEFSGDDHLGGYGSDAEKIRELMREIPELKKRIHPGYPFFMAEIVWAVRNEMARTVEDFLARRIRMLFLDAKASREMVLVVAEIIARELKKDDTWIKEQVSLFNEISSNYLPVSR